MEIKLEKITFKTLEEEVVVFEMNNYKEENKMEQEEFKEVSNYYFLLGRFLGGGLSTLDDILKVEVITFRQYHYNGLNLLYHVHVDDKKVIKETQHINRGSYGCEIIEDKEEIFNQEALICLTMTGAILASGLRGMESVIKKSNYFETK